MAQLGNTLESIANHKLGIAKPNMTCITTVDDSLKDYFKEYAKNNNVNMIFVNDVKNINVSDKTYFEYKNEKYASHLLGEYQAFNASLAIEAIKYFDKDYPKTLIDFALENIKWPGRMEVLNTSPLILLDGAHNIHAINAITNTISNLKKNRKVKTIFSALQDKEYPKMIKKLEEITDYFYFTKIIDLRQIEDIHFEDYTYKEYEINNDFKNCLDTAISKLDKNDILLITGSLHFVSQIREYYFKK